MNKKKNQCHERQKKAEEMFHIKRGLMTNDNNMHYVILDIRKMLQRIPLAQLAKFKHYTNHMYMQMCVNFN
jgi:hypothetical protein